MTLQIALDGADGGDAREVTMTRSGGRATVWIDGTASAVTATAEGEVTVLEIDGRRETVYCVIDRDAVFVHAFGRSWTLLVTDPVEVSMRADRTADAATAPMPGVLMSVAVEPGAEVAKGQIMAVIESMKMHTEIAAPRAGVVERVLVAIGESFDQGATLITLVPDLEPDDTEEG